MCRAIVILLIGSALVLIMDSCQDPTTVDEDGEIICQSLSDGSLQLVTGIRFYDENASPIGFAGNPNVANDRELYVYPNPTGPSLSLGGVDLEGYHLYIVPATKDTMCADLDYTDARFTYSEQALAILSSLDAPFGGMDMQVNLSTLPSDAFYKVILYSEGRPTLVENIYYSQSRPLNDVYIELLGAF